MRDDFESQNNVMKVHSALKGTYYQCLTCGGKVQFGEKGCHPVRSKVLKHIKGIK